MPKSDTFSVPSASTIEGWRPADHDGHLHLVIGPVERDETVTAHGEAIVAVPARIVCVTCGVEFEKPWVFPALLKTQMFGADGPLLGRLGHGPASAGKSAPWCLIDPTDADVAAADEYLAPTSDAF